MSRSVWESCPEARFPAGTPDRAKPAGRYTRIQSRFLAIVARQRSRRAAKESAKEFVDTLHHDGCTRHRKTEGERPERRCRTDFRMPDGSGFHRPDDSDFFSAPVSVLLGCWRCVGGTPSPGIAGIGPHRVWVQRRGEPSGSRYLENHV